MNYTELQARIADQVHRTDLTTNIPGFIELAEAFLFRELNIKELRLSVTGITTGEYAALPAEFGEVTRLTVTRGGIEHTLDYATQHDSYTVAHPSHYALERNQLRLFGAGTGTAYTLYYTPKVAPLTVGNPTNWVLDNAPDLYLYLGVLEACRYTQNTEEQARLGAMIAPMLDGIKRFAERRGQPTNSSLQIRIRR